MNNDYDTIDQADIQEISENSEEPAGNQIITYDNDDIREYIKNVAEVYKENQTVPLTFEDWKSSAFPLMYANPKKFKILKPDISKPIRVSPSAGELLDICAEHAAEFDDIQLHAPKEEKDFRITQLCHRIFVPKQVINMTEFPTIEGKIDGKTIQVPIWFNSTLKGINLRLGFEKGDSSLPSALTFDDTVVHGMVGGTTGSGKSATLNTIITNLLLEYAPWEIDIYLSDFKKVEFSRYANRVPTPHIRIVAATKSTEFLLSMADAIVKDMDDRNSLFVKVGVQNLEEFRLKFDLVLPRVIWAIDEFVQMYENIKASEDAGNDKAAEDKQKVNRAFSTVGRLGRNAGEHMLLSSQNMEGQLDDQTNNQFGAGVAMKCSASVSTSLIGNDAGSHIRGKGKAWINQNKLAKNANDNILVRIPLIQSKVEAEEEAKGKISDLQQTLIMLYKLSQKYGFDKGLFFYDEDSLAPFETFKSAIDYANEKLKKPELGNDAEDRAFVNNTGLLIPLGPEVKYTPDPTCCLPLQFNNGCNMIVHCDDKKIRNYIIRLLAEYFNSSGVRNFLLGYDESIYGAAQLDTLLLNQVFISKKEIPQRVVNIFESRSRLLEIQNLLTDSNKGVWSDELVMQDVIRKRLKHPGDALAHLSALVKASNDSLGRDDLVGVYNDSFKPISESDFVVLVEEFCKTKTNYSTTIRDTKTITPKSFETIVVWIAGLDSLTLDPYGDSKAIFKRFIEKCPTTNIFCVLLANKWGKLGDYAESCNFVLEKAAKDFFVDINLPKNMNVNENTYQLHDRDSKKNSIIKLYNLH